jgi:hypothetical protein
MYERTDIAGWRDGVIRALTDEAWRREVNDRVSAFAAERTWADTARRMVQAIEAKMAGKKAA